jgi:hypothetical protein
MEKKKVRIEEKTADLNSSLAITMSHIVNQFDMAYGKLKILRGEPGGISEKETLALIENAQKAVREFSLFMCQFSEKVNFKYYPPKGMGEKVLEEKKD